MYEIRTVVCDWGIYENGELKLIVSNFTIAQKILDLLNEDYTKSLEFNRSLINPLY